MYGKGTASISAQSAARDWKRRPRQSRKAQTTISATNNVPSPAMMWYAKKSSGMLSGQSSLGNASSPFTSARTVP